MKRRCAAGESVQRPCTDTQKDADWTAQEGRLSPFANARRKTNKQTKKPTYILRSAELTAAAKAAICKAMDGLRGGRQTSAAARMRAGPRCVVVKTTEAGKEGAAQT